MSLKLLVDDRERAVIPFFKEEYIDVELEVKRLHISDYAIMQGDKVLVAIERKSWRDLSSSIKDGRIENVNKLMSLRESTGCKVIYLIEGRCRNKPSKRFARIPYKSLLAHLDHLMLRDNIYVIYSNDEEDTAVRLIELCTNYLSLNLPVVGGSIEESQESQESRETKKELDILTTVVPKTDISIIYNLWSAIPNITTKTATLFIDAGYHISDLFLGKITKDEISVMKYSNGTIVGKRAEKIIKIKDNDNNDNYKHYCNIIAEIPGITKKTAARILIKATFNELLSSTLSIDELANLKKTEKSKIGQAAATKIYKFLIKPNIKKL